MHAILPKKTKHVQLELRLHPGFWAYYRGCASCSNNVLLSLNNIWIYFCYIKQESSILRYVFR